MAVGTARSQRVPPAGSPPGSRRADAALGRPASRRGAFLAPAVVLLGVWLVYPTICTIVRSFFDRAGDEFVGFDNYQEMFTDRHAR